MINKNKLQGAIKAAGLTQGELARLMKVSENTLSAKINGKGYFDTKQINDICEYVGIEGSTEKVDIFLS